jgi:hypothetical protein
MAPMTKAHLRACAVCARHVRVTEAACPFCGKELSDDFRAGPPPSPPRARLSRAALFSLGAGGAVLAPMVVIGCSESVETSISQLYGGAPFDGGEAVGDSGSVASDVQVTLPESGAEAGSDAPDEGSPPDAGDAGNPD